MTLTRFLVGTFLLFAIGALAVAWIYLGRDVRSVVEGQAPVPERLGARADSVGIPEARPFVGTEGVDEFGAPLKAPDRPALLQLLHLGMYDELDRHLAEYQADFEADPKKELWSIDAFEAFDDVDPALTLALDDWVTARPDAWTARMARGAHRVALGWFYRGARTGSKTGLARFEAMNGAFETAREDLERALAAKPKLVAAHRNLIQIGMASRRWNPRDDFDRATAACPTCFQIRATYLHASRPKWGGSHEEMRRVAREARAYLEANPRLAELDHFVTLDACDQADTEAACGPLRAARHWEHRLQLAEYHYGKKEYVEAKALLDRATPQRPQWPRLLEYRVRNGLAMFAGKSTVESIDPRAPSIDEVAADALTLRRMYVAMPRYERLADDVLEHVGWFASHAAAKGDRDRARALIAKGLAIRPEHPKLVELRANLDRYEASLRPKAERAATDTQADRIREIQRRVEASPDDFALRRELDAALFELNRFDDIVASWDAYLSRHPEDARAYFERGGTHSHRRDARAMLDDFDRACTLGLSPACEAATTMRQRLGVQ